MRLPSYTFTLFPQTKSTGQVSLQASVCSSIKQRCPHWLSAFLCKVPGKPSNETIIATGPQFLVVISTCVCGRWGMKRAVSVGCFANTLLRGRHQWMGAEPCGHLPARGSWSPSKHHAAIRQSQNDKCFSVKFNTEFVWTHFQIRCLFSW